EPAAPQLRVVGTSASLDGDSSEYLERFFGVPAKTFVQVVGRPRPVEATIPVPARIAGSLTPAELSAVITEACKSEGVARPTPLDTVAERAFTESAEEALASSLARLAGESSAEQVPFRAHYFVRTMRGIWA